MTQGPLPSLRRTGWRTSFRRCPTHGVELELVLDEGDRKPVSEKNLRYGWHRMYAHEQGRVWWHCRTCEGAWSEERFLAEQRLPARAHPLRIACPACHANTLDSDHGSDCCPAHTCRACGASWEVSAEVVTPGRAINRRDPPILGHHDVLKASGTPFDRRPCDACAAPTELVFARRFQCPDDEPFIAWRCAACGGVIEDFSWRPVVATFIDDAVPSVDCPSCRGYRLEGVASTSSDVVKCSECGASLRARVERETDRSQTDHS